MSHLLRALALSAVLILGAAACADGTAVGPGGPAPSSSDAPMPVESDGGIGDTPTTPSDETPIPVEPDGGIGSGAYAPDQPIPVEPDGGIGDGAGPPAPLTDAPDFGVSSETDSLSVPPSSYCWSAEGTGVCADGRPLPTDHPISAADQLVITYAEGELVAEAIPYTGAATDERPDGEAIALPVTVENPGINLVDTSSLEPGTYYLSLFWTGPQGDASAGLALTIAR